MKKSLSIVAVCVVVVGLALYLGVNTANSQGQTAAAPGYPRMTAQKRPGLLTRYVRENMAVQALAEITQQPVDTLRSKLQQERLPAVLAEYQVDRRVFFDAMRTKTKNLLGQLVDGNYLTTEQKDQIVERMDQYAQRRALMKTLIDKALADGTITAEQGQMLLKRPH